MTTTAIGIMSGTSLDGLDIAYCAFTRTEDGWAYSITAADCVAYDEFWRKKLSKAHQLSGHGLMALDAGFGSHIAEQVSSFLRKKNLPAPDLIASHGHTVHHAPQRGFTTQIGSGAHIAAGTGITTVNDFRSLDVALDGQGAPLVPMGDRLLFAQYGACLNLGGFSNISFERDGERMAMDICPVNILLNPMAERLGLPFDRGGQLAAEGKILPEVLNALNSLEIYQDMQGRPSLSREWTESHVWPLLLDDADPKDLLRTLTEHAATQMAHVINATGAAEVLVTGGGAYNTFLTDRMAAQCKARLTVPDRALVEFKEALVFALLGVLRLRGEVNVLRSVTGARTDSCSGSVHLMRL